MKTTIQDIAGYESQGNMTLSNDHKNLPVTNYKETEICDLPNKQFKMAILRNLN